MCGRRQFVSRRGGGDTRGRDGVSAELSENIGAVRGGGTGLTVWAALLLHRGRTAVAHRVNEGTLGV